MTALSAFPSPPAPLPGAHLSNRQVQVGDQLVQDSGPVVSQHFGVATAKGDIPRVDVLSCSGGAVVTTTDGSGGPRDTGGGGGGGGGGGIGGSGGGVPGGWPWCPTGQGSLYCCGSTQDSCGQDLTSGAALAHRLFKAYCIQARQPPSRLPCLQPTFAPAPATLHSPATNSAASAPPTPRRQPPSRCQALCAAAPPPGRGGQSRGAAPAAPVAPPPACWTRPSCLCGLPADPHSHPPPPCPSPVLLPPERGIHRRGRADGGQAAVQRVPAGLVPQVCIGQGRRVRRLPSGLRDVVGGPARPGGLVGGRESAGGEKPGDSASHFAHAPACSCPLEPPTSCALRSPLPPPPPPGPRAAPAPLAPAPSVPSPISTPPRAASSALRATPRTKWSPAVSFWCMLSLLGGRRGRACQPLVSCLVQPVTSRFTNGWLALPHPVAPHSPS
jgi:hypothetical protein